MKWTELKLEDTKENTALWKMKKLSSDLFSSLLKVVWDFKTLFLEHPLQEQVKAHTLKDLGEFLKDFLKRYFEKVKS